MTITVQIRPLQEAIDEVQRELDVRQRCYHRWIAEKKLSATDAKDRGERIEAAMNYLLQLMKLVDAGQVKLVPTVGADA